MHDKLRQIQLNLQDKISGRFVTDSDGSLVTAAEMVNRFGMFWPQRMIDPEGHFKSVIEASTHDNISLVFYRNHVSHADFPAFLRMYYGLLNKDGHRRLVVPASDWTYKNDRFFREMYDTFAYIFGFTKLPLIQAYQVEGLATDPSQVHYTREEFDTSNANFSSVIDRLKQVGQVDLFGFPEGTRSPDGMLGEMNAGFFFAAQTLAPSVLVPSYVSYWPKPTRGQNLFRQVNIVHGRPQCIERYVRGRAERTRIQDEATRELVRLVPVERRGHYASLQV